MNKTSRTALNVVVLVSLCIGFVLLSADWTVALVPTGIVALFFVNADPLLEALMGSWQSSDDGSR